MMKRLQDAIDHCYEVAKDQCGNKCGNEHIQLAKWLEDLQDFYELKQKGKLVELLCKPGDIVYGIYFGNIEEMRVNVVQIHKKTYIYFGLTIKGHVGRVREFSNDDIGKTVFLTKQKALETLEGMKNEQS